MVITIRYHTDSERIHPMKKFISLILILSMCLSLLPVTVWAEDPVTITYNSDIVLNENTEADTIIVNSEVQVTVAANVCLKVNQALTNNGTLIGEQDAQLFIGKNVTVSGLTLYNENTADEWTDFSHDETFIWLEKGDHDEPIQKWVRAVEPPDDSLHEYDYRIYYNQYDDNAKISVGEINLNSGDTLQFSAVTESEPATYSPVVFSIDQYPTVESELNAQLRIDINVLDGHDDVPNTKYSSAYDAPNKITVNENQFTFAPTSSAPFEVYVWWTVEEYEFDNFGYDDATEFQIRTNMNGNGQISFDKSPAKFEQNDEVFSFLSSTKTNFSSSSLPVTVTFTPDEGEALTGLVIGESFYSIEPMENELALSDLLKEGVYAFTVTEEMLKEQIEGSDPAVYRYKDLYIEAHFGCSGEPESSDNTFEISYDDRAGNASVKIGEATLVNGSQNNAFVTGEAITFTLTPDNSMEGLDPFVEIEVFDGSEDETVPNSTYSSRNDTEVLPLTENQGVYTVTFTPTSSAHFAIRVYWNNQNQFDMFGYNNMEEYQIVSSTIGKGSIILGEWSDRGRLVYNNQVKENYSSSNNPTLTVTFVPDQGQTLKRVFFDGTEYTQSPQGEQQPLSSLFTGSPYTITISADNLLEPIENTDPVEYCYKWVSIEAEFSQENIQTVKPSDGQFAVDFDSDVVGVKYSIEDSGTLNAVASNTLVSIEENKDLTLNIKPLTGSSKYVGNFYGIRVVTHGTTETAQVITVKDEELSYITETGYYTYTLPRTGNAGFSVQLLWNGFLWYTISYANGGNLSTEHGQVIAERVHINGNTYSIYESDYSVNESDHIYPMSTITGGNSDITGSDYKQSGDNIYTYGLATNDKSDMMIMRYVEGVVIDYKFIPDYGYQVTAISDRENNNLLGDFTPGDAVSTFSYEVPVNRNVHFMVTFSKTEDSFDLSGASKVTGFHRKR